LISGVLLMLSALTPMTAGLPDKYCYRKP